jgi:hypothetical protein
MSAHDSPTLGTADDDSLIPERESSERESSKAEQLKLIAASCFEENLAAYLAVHEEINFTALDIRTAVKNLIKGGVIDEKILDTLRKHASAFYEFAKANSERTITVRRNEGVREAGRRQSDAIRSIMGKIDPLIGISAKLSELVSGFDLMKKLQTRLAQIEDFGRQLGMEENDIAAMKEEITELVREKCLPYTQSGAGYKKLKTLGEEMHTIGATSLGIDMSGILGKYMTKYMTIEEIGELVKKDLPEAAREVAEHAAENSETYRAIILLGAMRKTVAPETVMRQMNLPGFGEKTGFETMFKAKKEPASIFFYNADGKTGKTRKKMETLSQWLSMTLARIMNNQVKEKNGEERKPLHDNMTGWDPKKNRTDEERKGEVAKFVHANKAPLPDFDDRDIVEL